MKTFWTRYAGRTLGLAATATLGGAYAFGKKEKIFETKFDIEDVTRNGALAMILLYIVVLVERNRERWVSAN